MTRLLIPALLGVAAAGEAAALDEYRWTARPILVFSAPDDPRLVEQNALFAARAEEMRDRCNVLIVAEPDSELAREYRPGDFTVILVGLDGGEKFRADRIVAPSELEALIDLMPMRRQELRRAD
ncbi:MAG: DUF4174 domain-containing protein [Pseudomonadota bacterium]